MPNSLRGARYRLVNRANYDLCAKCEAGPLERYPDPSFVFLKIPRPLPLPPLPLPPDVSNHACGQLKVPREKRRLCDKSTRRVDVRGVRLPSGDAIMAVAVLMRLLLPANLSFYARALPLRVYEDTHPFHAAS